MKKLGLTLFSCIALVAFMGLSGTALAAEKHDPDCDAYGNPFAVFGFWVDTPDSHVEHAISRVAGGGLACGSSIDGTYLAPVGWESLNDTAVIKNPPGVTQNPAPGPGLALGDYVGRSTVDALGWVPFLGAQFFDNRIVVLRVDDPAGTDDDCPDSATQCFLGRDRPDLQDPPQTLELGHGWVWTEAIGDGLTQLTIGPFHPAVGDYSGLTQIDSIDFCKYAGTTGDACGDSSRPWLQKNGDKSTTRPTDCLGGKGVYTVTVTNKAGAMTAAQTSCVPWTPQVYRYNAAP